MILIPWCPKHDMQAMVCMVKNEHEPTDEIETKEVPDDYYGANVNDIFGN